MRHELRTAGFAIVGLAVLSVVLGSLALVSCTQRAGEDDTGTLDISSIDLYTGAREATLSAHDMLPGDLVTAAVTVVNSGSQPMTYAMHRGPISVGGAPLAASLRLTIKAIGSSCADFDGVTLFEGPLDQAAFGRESDGRPLAGASAEILCFRAVLPLDTGNALQGATTTVALSFGATKAAAAR